MVRPSQKDSQRERGRKRERERSVEYLEPRARGKVKIMKKFLRTRAFRKERNVAQVIERKNSMDSENYPKETGKLEK